MKINITYIDTGTYKAYWWFNRVTNRPTERAGWYKL